MKREIDIGKSEYISETERWKKSLYSFLQENALLKTKLAKVLDDSNSKNLLAQAEDFQNLFVLKDEFIKELYNDISAQQAVLKKYDILNNSVLLHQQKLRNEMHHFEKNFSGLRTGFTKFLSNAFQD
ncbi:MAG: hypothetical protein ABIY51_12450 [Ferruginibacter sp.]